MGIAAVLACYGFWYLLPFVAFLLGLVAWVQARDALNPKRTKWLAGGAMISSGVMMAIFALVTAIMMCVVFSASISSRSGPPPTPYFYATPTPYTFPCMKKRCRRHLFHKTDRLLDLIILALFKLLLNLGPRNILHLAWQSTRCARRGW